ncbi:swib mdm2 domain protein [Seiridium cupressi]
MSVPLSSEEQHQYTEIIDGILATANLETISRKKIREGLESALGGKDLKGQKAAIKLLIEERFDAISTSPPENDLPALPHAIASSPHASPKRQANSHNSEDIGANSEVDEDEIQVSAQPPKKKQRKSEGTEDADAKLAAMLQAQENRLGRATRGGGSKSKPAKKKATPRKKSSNKVRLEDDSDLSDSDASGPKRRKAGGGFQKPFNLSTPLADVCGEATLSRPQVVKKLWEHIKGNQLQDPKDKRQILCDEKMQAIFKQSKVDMFQMNKLVGNHLYPIEEPQ